MNKFKRKKDKNMENNINFRQKTISNELKKSAKGITLIALVITIIVLLILAGVSIAMLTGNNGILTQANESKTRTEEAEAREKLQLEIMGSYGQDGKIDIEQLNENLKNLGIENAGITKLPAKVEMGEKTYAIAGNGSVIDLITIEDAKSDNMLENTENKAIEDNGNIVIVPAGFKLAVDSGATVKEGIVIEDNNIEINGDGTKSTGNQFVWVPVSQEYFDTVFVRRKGYFNGTEQALTNYGEADSTGKNSNPEVKESSATQQEAKEMYASVKANGGFYIGRYEAGTTSETPRTSNVAENVVIKKGANVYNYVTWSKNKTMNEEKVIEGTENNPDGAVELARNFGIKNGYKTVTSTLCYGVQWDAVLTWIDPEYDDFAKKSDGMGWYSGVEGNESHQIGIDLKDGENIKNMTKKIYDLAGNVYEWTMESYYTHGRVYRGGGFNGSGSDYPASYRDDYGPSGSSPDIGFRVTLYL